MDPEILAVCAVLGIGLLPLALFRAERALRALAAGIWMIASLVLLVGANSYRAATIEPPVTNRPTESPRDSYVTSDACRACHPHQYETWSHSWHRTMTQVATPEAILGDFDSWPDGDWNVRREGDAYWVHFADRERGKKVERPVVMTTGSHHMQVYWFSMSDEGHDLGQLPFVFLKDERRWVPRSSIFIKPEEEHPSPEHRRWNGGCVFCHTTQPEPRITRYGINSKAVEFGIACEACHGPGATHVRANAPDPLHRYRQHLSEARDETIVNAAHLPKERSVEVCGQCHGMTLHPNDEERARALVYGNRYKPGEVLEQTGRIVMRGGLHVDEPRIAEVVERYRYEFDTAFWSDGMIRTPRELNGLLESPCYQKGEMTCLSCHTMHKPAADPRSYEEWADDQLIDGMRGDRACLQCHSGFSADLEAHTHHAPESDGSRCQNCHMPYTAYALLKAIRQHEIDVPTVAASIEAGRPNACNACHLDRTLAWSASFLHDWYGQAELELDPVQRQVAASLLWTHTGDAGQRALMAWHAGWEPAQRASGREWLVPHLAQLLEDPYAAVRFIAWRSLRSMPEAEGVAYDYVGPEPGRAAAKRAVWNRWSAQPRPAGDRGAALLLFPDGALDRVALQHLLERRNDRAIFIAE